MEQSEAISHELCFDYECGMPAVACVFESLDTARYTARKLEEAVPELTYRSGSDWAELDATFESRRPLILVVAYDLWQAHRSMFEKAADRFVRLILVHREQSAAPVSLNDEATVIHLSADAAGENLQGIVQILRKSLQDYLLEMLGIYQKRTEELAGVLEDVRQELASFYHDINNPLSILSGNAQLLVELARSQAPSPDFMQPVTDIEASSRRVIKDLRRIISLRERIHEA